MEKLIELLNEYGKENGRNFEVKEIGMTYRNNDLMVISKRYGFIKRLVDNDKIRYEKVREQVDKEPMSIGRGLKHNILLMLLAISDNPIEDLISYLK